MRVFVADINEVIGSVELEGKCKVQTEAGRFLTQLVAQKIYNIKDTEIKIKNKKPYFVNSGLNFNIAHSGNWVGVCFDDNPVGFDLEEMRDRDFEALLKRYKISAADAKPIFYRFWCQYEAKLKLQAPEKSLAIFRIFNGYMAAIASDKELDIKNELQIFKLDCPSQEFEAIFAQEFFEPINIGL